MDSIVQRLDGRKPSVEDAEFDEEVKVIGNPQNNPYSNTYNPGWRNHPNFSWRDQDKSGNSRQYSNQRGYSQDQKPPSSQEQEIGKKSLEEIVGELAQATSKLQVSTYSFINESRNNFKNQEASIKNLENQVGQISKQLSEIPPGRALCDLGASINLMPLTMFERLDIGEVTPTMISLQLADRSLKTPYGVVEDVLVRVDKFVFPVDFVVLDMEEDTRVPLILGRPFLATGRALIDVELGTMDLRVADERVTFYVWKNMKHPNKEEDVFRVEVVDEFVCKEFMRISMKDPYEAVMMEVIELDDLDFEEEEVSAAIGQLDSLNQYHHRRNLIEELHRDEESSEKKDKAELKQLPFTLKYVYLEEGESKPVIINKSPSLLEEEKLLLKV
ncbi:uncharacterized protein LOC130712882 [Lotus japonicus]|uniref:uncharacterized protein LOC130712882 n=1 Tax=Lotus japonicus TaxID=34305 RepID=UPI0025856B18|nr:uncharacterized protein LOC130712882 [Lotus japonicus]